MDKEELAALIDNQERTALGYNYGDLAKARAKALDYYLGKPFGNEVEGRSQVVSSDVFDVVEGMLPQLVKIFASTNTAVEFEPVGLEDEKDTKQATAACNHVFYKQNNGVLILYQWFKDALIQKNGIVGWEFDEKKVITEEDYEGLTDNEFQKLVAEDEVEVLAHTEYPDEDGEKQLQEKVQQFLQSPQGMQMQQQAQQSGQPLPPLPKVPPLHDVKIRVTKKKNYVCINVIPPEEFLITPSHNSIDLDDCVFCEHRTRMTISDLKQMGYSDADLEDIGSASDAEVKWTVEYQARHQFAEELSPEQSESSDPTMKEIWVGRGYIRADYDGDGIAELVKFTRAGKKVLDTEAADQVQFAALTPIVMPHRFIGMSFADVAMDFQDVNSVLWRQGLDNLYLTNNPRHAVVEGQANLDDLLTSRPGGIVRMRAPGAVTPLETPFVAQHIFPMLEYNESRKENRTGISRYNQGTDGDSLNKTAHGVQLIQNAAMARTELVARMFAETGVKRLFRGIKKTLYKSGLRKLSIRLNNEYVDVDPREWKYEWDMTVNVGLGTGNKDQQLVHLNQMLQLTGAISQMGKGYMFSEENIYNLYAKIVENSGFQHVAAFVTHPESIDPKAKQPPPNPELIKLQAEQQMGQAKLQATDKLKQMELQSAQGVEQQNAQLEKYKVDQQIASQERIAIAQIDAQKEIEQMRLQHAAHLKVFDANTMADVKTAEITHAENVKAAELAQEKELELARMASQEKVAKKKVKNGT